MSATRRWADAQTYIDSADLEVQDDLSWVHDYLMKDIEDEYRGYGHCPDDPLYWFKRATLFVLTGNSLREQLGEYGTIAVQTGRPRKVYYMRVPGGAYELDLSEYGRDELKLVDETRLIRFITAASYANDEYAPILHTANTL